MIGGTFSREEVQAFERMRAEELFEIARFMTEIGLPGADPIGDPRVEALVNRGLAATEGGSLDDLKEWIARHK